MIEYYDLILFYHMHMGNLTQRMPLLIEMGAKTVGYHMGNGEYN